MPWRLWLDDQYDDEEMPFRHPPEGFTPAKTSAEAIQLVEEKGIPFFISFDHDLGNGDDAIIFLNWLSEKHYDAPVPHFQIHSANPPGRDNIASKMSSWKRSQLL
jgi:hypothetical protein